MSKNSDIDKIDPKDPSTWMEVHTLDENGKPTDKPIHDNSLEDDEYAIRLRRKIRDQYNNQ